MPKPTPFPEGSVERLRLALKRARTKGQHQMVLCVWMRAVLHLKSDVIALALDMSGQAVRKIHMDFLRDGEAIFNRRGKGGRHREHLPVKAEREFLEGLLEETRPGNALFEAGLIQEAYEKMVGHPVSSTVVYRMLKRHGWRRLATGSVATAQRWAVAQLNDAEAAAARPARK